MLFDTCSFEAIDTWYIESANASSATLAWYKLGLIRDSWFVTRCSKILKWTENGVRMCNPINTQKGRKRIINKVRHRLISLWYEVSHCVFLSNQYPCYNALLPDQTPFAMSAAQQLLFSPRYLNQLSLDYEAAANVGKQSARPLLCLFWACSRRLNEGNNS